MYRTIDDIFVTKTTSYRVADIQVGLVLPYTMDKKTQDEIEKQKKMKGKASHEVYVNEFLPGFFVVKLTKTTFSAYHDSWYIADPRGFAVLISNQNFENILRNTNICSGVINHRCIWIREGTSKKLMLVTENDPLYQKACEDTKLLANKPTPRSVNIGAKVQLDTGEIAEYMGKMHIVTTFDEFAKVGNIDVNQMVHTYKTSMKRDIFKLATGKYLYRKPGTVWLIHDNTPHGTLEGNISTINVEIDACSAAFASDSVYFKLYPTYCAAFARHVTAKHIKPWKYRIVELSKQELTDVELKTAYYGDTVGVLYEDEDAIQYVMSKSNYISPANAKLYEVSDIDLNIGTLHRYMRGKDTTQVNIVKAYAIEKYSENNKFI